MWELDLHPLSEIRIAFNIWIFKTKFSHFLFKSLQESGISVFHFHHWHQEVKCSLWNVTARITWKSSVCSETYLLGEKLFLLLLLLRFPATSLGFTVRGEIFAYIWPFLNPAIEVVTLHLRGWCMWGVFLMPAFTRLGHECQDLLSLCNGVHVCTD